MPRPSFVLSSLLALALAACNQRTVRLERGSLEVTKEVVRTAGWESLVWLPHRTIDRGIFYASKYLGCAQIEMAHNGRAERFGGETVAPEGRVFRFTSDGQRHWFRLNIRSADGKLLTLTNPIYLDFK
jgi:hypothetical protein